MITTQFSRAAAIIASLSTLAATALIVVNPIAGFNQTSSAASSYLAQISNVEVAGLVIKYRDGVNPIAANGQITGANFAGVSLQPGHGIGLNMYSVRFADRLSKVQIANAMANLARSPKVSFVAPDQVIKFSAASYVPQKASAKKAGPIAASAVLNLKAVDAWYSKKPKLAQILLTWAKPTNLFGAKILGYEIDRSTDGGRTFSALVTQTKSSTYRFVANKDLYAGFSYRFRVRAITTLNSRSTFGRFSAVVKAAPTTMPQSPVFAAGDAVTDSKAPAWLAQNLNQRGGLPVTYVVTASAPGVPDVVCTPATAAAKTCTFVGLDPTKSYRAVVTATNAHGSTQSRLTQTATDPMFFHQWYLTGKYGINAPSGWAFNKGAYQTGATTTHVTVAVLDTGFTAHPDLDNQYVKENGQVYGYDFVSNLSKGSNCQAHVTCTVSHATNDNNGWDSNPTDPGDYQTSPNSPSSWHGTHVTGLIAAEANNGIGVTGVASEARILPVRVLGPEGGLSSDLAAAITWAVGLPVPQFAADNAFTTVPPVNLHPAQVINISMGTSGPNFCDSATQAAVDAAKANKVTIVTAAGNSLMEATNSYPGNCIGTINVGATSSVGDRAVYSNSGPGVDVSAPGGDATQTANTDADAAGMILSTINTGTRGPLAADYGYEEGTSMSAPLVAGVVALMYAAHPGISFEQAATIIINTATPFNNDPSLTFNSGSQAENDQLNVLGHCYNPHVALTSSDYNNDGRCGSGIVNAGAAVAAAAALP